jgi:hypothetical protein
MILISHRGNLNGKFESYENEPMFIDKAISEGYDVEVDVWYIDGVLFLGHDKPQYGVDFRWFKDRLSKLWVHCKNIESILYFQECGYEINYFWHQEDDITLTSKNFIWTFPGKKLTSRSIAVLPESVKDWELTECLGICSDYIKKYKK